MLTSSQLIELKCRNCGSPLNEASISRELGVAKCPHCRAVFALPPPLTTGAGQEPIPRPQIGLPRRFEIKEREDRLTITQRWFTPLAIFLVFFTLIWNAFILVFLLVIPIFAPLLVLHISAGVFLIYLTAALFVNSTRITASRTALRVDIGPLPWRGNKIINPASVVQLFCTEKIVRGEDGSAATYQVVLVMQGNQREILIAGFRLPEEAWFIEQQLERYLGIADRPVSGEYGR